MGADGRSQSGILRVFQCKDETRAFYNKISKVYDLLAERSEEPIRRLALEKLDAHLGEKILEIGFGTGHCLEELAREVGEGGKAYGIDLSDEMTRIAREKLRLASLADRVQLTCGDAASLPYPSDSMDAVLMSFTLELFDTPEISVVLAECKRVLRGAGRIVVAGMSKEGEGGVIFNLFEWTHQRFPNYLDCRPIFVRGALEEAGFQIISSDKRTIWVPVEIVLASKASP